MCLKIKRGLPEVEGEICCEDRCRDKVNAHFLRIMLKIISTKIISILCNFDHFQVKNIHHTHLISYFFNLSNFFLCMEAPTFLSWSYNITQVTPLNKLCMQASLRSSCSRVWWCISHLHRYVNTYNFVCWHHALYFATSAQISGVILK